METNTQINSDLIYAKSKRICMPIRNCLPASSIFDILHWSIQIVKVNFSCNDFKILILRLFHVDVHFLNRECGTWKLPFITFFFNTAVCFNGFCVMDVLFFPFYYI